MTRKSPNRTLSQPQCRNCGRYWRPAEGVIATSSYCRKCAQGRRKSAAEALGLRPLTAAETIGPYLPPRLLRSS